MKLLILIAYFIVLITIGFVCRQKATDVNGFVLGGRSVGPWLTAFAYGTSGPVFVVSATCFPVPALYGQIRRQGHILPAWPENG